MYVDTYVCTYVRAVWLIFVFSGRYATMGRMDTYLWDDERAKRGKHFDHNEKQG